ncbi:lipoprotein insertase outer membrane protein LolB [Marinobacterium jannaschii]|uniref:lipoprotein insertase outer membrane protein LolB n=1 Tax=Marinobacterium jannaschii TaxID=64970 RepID=UPI000480FF07|nr:lipoprotein insertase outer membrane protein LolB [Marinobacterium jannaschii]
MKLRSILPLLLISIVLAGCSGFQQADAPAERQLDWAEYRQYMARLNHWELLGKIGIRSDAEALSASMQWQQQQSRYAIQLRGPLGQGGADIQGDPRQVSIEIPGEGRYEADNPELLLQQTTGWQLPISDIQYWIRGIPSPQAPFEQVIEKNRLQTLDQNGWHIQYVRYQRFGVLLPSKIKLSRGQIRITLVVKKWQISA